jgi:ABC-2 type transport system ATP-binding protein
MISETAVLRTHDLRRRFGKILAVDSLRLELHRGEIYAFLGRNGAGKTTTLRMLMGVLRPDGGEIELDGRKSRFVSASLKRRLGYVSQEQVFYPWMNALQLGRFVAGFYPTWDKDEFARLLKLLDVPPDRKAAQLSGGTRMKLGVALALAHRPSVLLLDEPTASLDPVARRELLEILADQTTRHGQTVLFSSHLVAEVEQIAHRVGILDEGRLRYQGPLSHLRSAVRRAVWSTPAEIPPPRLSERPDLELLRDEPRSDGTTSWVLRGPPESWEQLAAAGAIVTRLTLEEIFLAYARKTDLA